MWLSYGDTVFVLVHVLKGLVFPSQTNICMCELVIVIFIVHFLLIKYVSIYINYGETLRKEFHSHDRYAPSSSTL